MSKDWLHTDLTQFKILQRERERAPKKAKPVVVVWKTLFVVVGSGTWRQPLQNFTRGVE